MALKPCNKENMQKFVDALRSGQYSQTTGRLEFINGKGKSSYCCLGVACHVSQVANRRIIYSSGSVTYDEVVGELPLSVMEWLGISEEVPVVRVPDISKVSLVDVSATALNDDSGLGFKEIADAFELTYLKD